MSGGVEAFLDHVTEIDGKTLVASCRSHRCCSAGGRFSEFGREADWTVFDFCRDLELRHAFDKAMHFRESTKIEMSEALVPEHTQCRSS